MRFYWLVRLIVFTVAAVSGTSAPAQPLKRNPTPQDYVERNGGGATVVLAGEFVLDGNRLSCGKWATVLDPNLNDYAASYPRFVVLNNRAIGRVPTAVKLWIYNHECGHLFGGPDEDKADCFAVRRGRTAGWLGSEGLGQVCAFISAARPDAKHVGGVNRCARIRQCWKEAAPHGQ